MVFPAASLVFWAVAVSGGTAKEFELPDRWQFRSAMERHVDVDPTTNISRALCHKIRHYRPKRTSEGLVSVSYQQLSKKGRWEKKSAHLQMEADHWIWIDGDQPVCTIYILGRK
jgi:hypothetical protein